MSPFSAESNLLSCLMLWKIPCQRCVCFERNMGSVQLLSRDRFVVLPRIDCALQLDDALDSRNADSPWPFDARAFRWSPRPQKQLWQLWFKWLTAWKSKDGEPTSIIQSGSQSAGGPFPTMLDADDGPYSKVNSWDMLVYNHCPGWKRPFQEQFDSHSIDLYCAVKTVGFAYVSSNHFIPLVLNTNRSVQF